VPSEPAEVRAALLAAVGARPRDAEPVAVTAAGADPVAALRVAYRLLLPLAAQDLTGAAPLDQVAAELADLAAAVLEAALAIARAALPEGSHPCRTGMQRPPRCVPLSRSSFRTPVCQGRGDRDAPTARP
jgi:glutamate-ammonia-ligase adenylyltransferase